MARGFVLLPTLGLLAWGLLPCAAGAQQSPPQTLTQRRINEFAAALEQAWVDVVVAPQLRGPGEPLLGYVARLARTLPGEGARGREARVAGYLAALARAADATAPLRREPALRDDSPVNRERWRRIARDAVYLPGRVAKLRAVWGQELRRQKGKQTGASPSLKSGGLGAELAQTLALVIATRDALRDARP